jgi:hypothetical protein
MTRYEEYLIVAREALVEFISAMYALAADAANVCGATDTSFFVVAADTISGLLCTSLKTLSAIRTTFRCSTWLPIYYEVVYNAMCYNGTGGVWALAATQFTVVFMACIIMTFRAVFWDLEISSNDDVVGKNNVDPMDDGKDEYSSQQRGFSVVSAPGGTVEHYGTDIGPSTEGGGSSQVVGLVNAKAY